MKKIIIIFMFFTCILPVPALCNSDTSPELPLWARDGRTLWIHSMLLKKHFKIIEEAIESAKATQQVSPLFDLENDLWIIKMIINHNPQFDECDDSS